MPGSGTPEVQVHDINGGITPSGLFWTVPLPPGAFDVSANGRRARLRLEDVCLIDTFQIFGTNMVPAAASLDVEWSAQGPFVARGSGDSVPPTDPAAFQAQFALARATGSFSGREIGFAFVSRGSSERGFAEMGFERNGVFL